MRRTLLLAAALSALLASGCADGASDAEAPTTISVQLPDPPWRTEPPIPATGLNAEILARFREPDAERTGCRPLGIDTSVWDPPPSFDRPGDVYITRWGDQEPPSEQQRLRDGDGSITEWSDGSFSSNVRLVDGTYRFDVEIPVNDAGTPGDWCTYVYEPTKRTDTGSEIVRSLRFIDQPDNASEDG